MLFRRYLPYVGGIVSWISAARESVISLAETSWVRSSPALLQKSAIPPYFDVFMFYRLTRFMHSLFFSLYLVNFEPTPLASVFLPQHETFVVPPLFALCCWARKPNLLCRIFVFISLSAIIITLKRLIP